MRARPGTRPRRRSRRARRCAAAAAVRVARSSVSGFSQSARAKSVRTSPGAMQLTRTLCGPYSYGQVARELEVGRLGDVVGADDRAAAQAADRRDDDHRAFLALDHLRHAHVDQPVVADDVVVQDLAELLVADAGRAARSRDWSRHCRPARRCGRTPGWCGRPGPAAPPWRRCWRRRRSRGPRRSACSARSATSSHGMELARRDGRRRRRARARRSAMARPMPLEDPVTMATLPVRSNKMDMKISSKRGVS